MSDDKDRIDKQDRTEPDNIDSEVLEQDEESIDNRRGAYALTQETIDAIAKGIRLGLTHEDAARYAGISRATFYQWKKLGQEPNAPAPYVEFAEAVEQAEVQGQAISLAAIHQAARGGAEITETRKVYKFGQLVERREQQKQALPQWQAAAWLLSHRFPQRWGAQPTEIFDPEDTARRIREEVAAMDDTVPRYSDTDEDAVNAGTSASDTVDRAVD